MYYLLVVPLWSNTRASWYCPNSEVSRVFTVELFRFIAFRSFWIDGLMLFLYLCHSYMYLSLYTLVSMMLHDLSNRRKHSIIQNVITYRVTIDYPPFVVYHVVYTADVTIHVGALRRLSQHCHCQVLSLRHYHRLPRWCVRIQPICLINSVIQ